MTDHPTDPTDEPTNENENFPTEWYACEYPERPTNPYVRWHYRGCVGCQVKANAVMLQHPNDKTTNRVLTNLMDGRER